MLAEAPFILRCVHRPHPHECARRPHTTHQCHPERSEGSTSLRVRQSAANPLPYVILNTLAYQATSTDLLKKDHRARGSRKARSSASFRMTLATASLSLHPDLTPRQSAQADFANVARGFNRRAFPPAARALPLRPIPLALSRGHSPLPATYPHTTKYVPADTPKAVRPMCLW
jgi:hypothetical protein